MFHVTLEHTYTKHDSFFGNYNFTECPVFLFNKSGNPITRSMSLTRKEVLLLNQRTPNY